MLKAKKRKIKITKLLENEKEKWKRIKFLKNKGFSLSLSLKHS